MQIAIDAAKETALDNQERAALVEKMQNLVGSERRGEDEYDDG